jgi:CheY-like chemotaxis protein
MTTPHAALVLVAEDPFIGTFLRTLLGRHGYRVEATSPARAFEMVSTGELRPDLLITNSPQDFIPVADRIAILYTAAMPDSDLASRFPVCRMLRKPFRNEEILEAVASLVS